MQLSSECVMCLEAFLFPTGEDQAKQVSIRYIDLEFYNTVFLPLHIVESKLSSADFVKIGSHSPLFFSGNIVNYYSYIDENSNQVVV